MNKTNNGKQTKKFNKYAKQRNYFRMRSEKKALEMKFQNDLYQTESLG